MKAGVTYAYDVQRGIHRSSSMANTQQGQGSGSGTRSNQDPAQQKSGTGQQAPAQKSGTGQQDPAQKSGTGQQGKPNDMNKGGNQPGSGSQQSSGNR